MILLKKRLYLLSKYFNEIFDYIKLTFFYSIFATWIIFIDVLIIYLYFL